MSEVPILCLDGDSAGQKAAIRAAHRALPMLAPGRSLAFVTLPQGQDPDDLIQSDGKDAFERLISKAVSLDEFLWRVELAGARTDTPDGRALLKERLEQRASEITHSDLQYEYKRSFLKRYFDLFGIKKNSAKAIHEAVAAAVRHPGRGVEYALGRAVLLGLMRHPDVLLSYCEEVGRLRWHDRYLKDWHSELMELPHQYSELTEDIVDQILSQTKVAPIELRNYERDLAFSFYRKSSDREEAETDLKKVIDLLIEEEETRVALELARGAFVADTTEERFAEQTRCQRQALATKESLFEWLERASQTDEAA